MCPSNRFHRSDRNRFGIDPLVAGHARTSRLELVQIRMDQSLNYCDASVVKQFVWRIYGFLLKIGLD